MSEISSQPARHEQRDVNLRDIVIVGVILVVIAAVLHVVVWWVFVYLQKQDRADKVSPFPLAVEERGRLPGEPRLEQIERMQGKSDALYGEEQRQLNSYGWVNEDAGIVRVPIDRAMKIIADDQRLPVRQGEARR